MGLGNIPGKLTQQSLFILCFTYRVASPLRASPSLVSLTYLIAAMRDSMYNYWIPIIEQ